MAHPVPEPAALPAVAAEFAAEFERLAGRPLTEAEREIARRASSGSCADASQQRAIWAESFLPESLAYLAVALSSSEGQRVLFVSPSADLLEHRQLRLKNRGPTTALSELARQTDKSSGVTVWATPNQTNSSHLARAFGSGGPSLIILEDAHAILGESFAFRPSMAGLKDIVARFKDARVIVAAAARGEQFRAKIGKALGLPALLEKVGADHSVVESIAYGSTGPLLRVTSEESEVIDAIVGPLPRPCVVLCSTPAQADQVYTRLEAEQVPVHRYHSGLPASDRARELVHFALPGRRAVMVAVSSYGPASGFAGQAAEALPEEFGHGYARRDIRSLVHLCAPCSLDQYTRELALLSSGGRFRRSDSEQDATDEDAAPREDEAQVDSLVSTAAAPAVALMLYNPAHLALNLALLKRKRPATDALAVAIDGLLGAQKGQYRNISALDPSGGTSPRSLSLVIDFLKDLGVIEVRGSEVRAIVGVPELKAAQRALVSAFDALSAGDAPRLEEVEQYALSPSCRVHTLQKLLGQTPITLGSKPALGEPALGEPTLGEPASSDGCGRCDVCAPGSLLALFGAHHAVGSPSPTIETLPMKRRKPARRQNKRVQEDDDLLESCDSVGDNEFTELDHDLGSVESFSA